MPFRYRCTSLLVLWALENEERTWRHMGTWGGWGRHDMSFADFADGTSTRGYSLLWKLHVPRYSPLCLPRASVFRVLLRHRSGAVANCC
jgi:hypothetical protein